MISRLGTVQLLGIEAVVLDVETTGLDIRTARLVQIGAVRIHRGSLAGTEFMTFVNPGMPIPPAATAVHGIEDHDVAGAPAPGEALSALADFVGGRPVIGHAVGFDLAILAAEAKHARATPLTPRWLDTRVLAEIVAPPLPEFTLETLCAWLGIPLKGRHSAIGDARMTAQIFCALVPHLRARGIRSWAEAEAASRRNLEKALGARATTRLAAAPPPYRQEAVDRIDAFPFRHRLREIMTAPPVFLADHATVLDAMQELAARRISSVFLSDATGPGIVTERDLLRAVASHGPAALDAPANVIASRPLACVSADAFVHRAIGRITRLGIRHLGVTDEAGKLVGAVSARDLLKVRATEALRLGDTIDAAEDAAALAAAWSSIIAVAEALLAEGVDAVSIAAVISDEIVAATRRAAELAEAALRAEGRPPPIAYALLVLGSAGRGESLLALDQDNAIVFAAGEPDGPEDRYFADLGSRIADILDDMGVAYCNGGVMAREKDWRGSLETWRERVASWLGRSNPRDLLAVDIFFDARAAHGEIRLADTLLAEARGSAAAAPQFLKLLAEASPDPAGTFGLFGHIRTDDGRINLKRAGLLPMVSAARVMAIRHGVAARSTRERLRAVRDLGIGGEADLTAALEAHAVLIGAILRQQIRDLHAGTPASNKVELRKLARRERDEVRDALAVAPLLKDLVRDLLF